VARLLDWLDPAVPAVVCGDMNAPPDFGSMRAMARRLPSAHATAQGAEPDWTFPTGLRPGSRWRGWLNPWLMHGAGWFLWHRHAAWRGTLDYIFADARFAVRSCEVAFDRPAPGDPRLYPSDHLGLVARLTLPR
jgi:endonuclease/exonuclease/phosphatase family metal-dependent hydrolase